MSTRHSSSCLLLLAGIWLLPTLAAAQPVPSRDPDTTHIFPAGGRRGSTLPVHVGTECFPPGARLKFYGQGIHASDVLETEVSPGTSAYASEPTPRRKPEQVPICYPRQWQAELKIEPEAQLGPHFWRATCAQGGSRARIFVVGDLPEFIETESNSSADRAERVYLPVTINGRIAGERDLDYYTFAARAGQVIHCEVLAGRLGSPLDPVVTIYDDQGRRVPVQETHLGIDPLLTFRVPSSGDYRLLLANVSLHGGPNYVYRVTLTAARRRLLAFPAGGQAGKTTNLQLFSPSGTGDWEAWQEKFQFLASATQRVVWQPGADDSALRLEVGPLPETMEIENNGTAQQAQQVAVPQTINGRFSTVNDEDWFRITLAKDQRLALQVRPAPLASRATPTLEILDSRQTSLGRASAYETPGRDCRLVWKCPAAGEYFVRLQDARHGFQGGLDFIYRLTIAVDEPDFELSLSQDQLSLVPGGKTPLTVDVVRRGGFDEPITLECRDLPAGVGFEPREVPRGKTSIKLTFSAAEDARPLDLPLQLEGVARIGDDERRRTAHAPHAAQDATGASLAEATWDRLFLTVRHKPVFRLYCAEAYLYAHRGMVFPYSMQIERLDDFQGEIVLQSGDRQNRDLDGVVLQRNVVPGNASATSMPILLPESMHANVQSQSQLYVQGYTRFVDRWGDKQSLLVVSEKRCMLRTLPTVVKLKAAVQTLAVTPGATVRIALKLKRTSNFSGPMQLDLVGAPRGVTIEPDIIAAQEEEIEVDVQFPASLPIGERWKLHFRASGEYPGHLELISETAVEVVVR